MARQSMAQRQAIKLEFQLKRFEVNLKHFREESVEEMRKVVVAGASAFATSAQKHTPPSMGKPKIENLFYENGALLKESDREKTPGRRQIYDTVALARSEGANDRGYWGNLARKGILYVVKIFRKGKRRMIECKTLAQAQAYARMTYRGLMRAAWALSFGTIGRRGKFPPAFNYLLQNRPELASVSSLNTVRLDEQNVEVSLTNHAIPNNAGFVASTVLNSDIAAVRTMNDQLERFFRKKYEL